MTTDISIIIPTYNNQDYIDETIDSIVNNNTEINYEILIGIDGCKKTLNHILNQTERYGNLKIKVFSFKENVGPYIIRNSLIDQCSSNNILFFDSDDIMEKDLISDVLSLIDEHSYIRFLFYNFNHPDKDKTIRISGDYAIGVFAIKKDLFNKYTAFQPWICAADTEFEHRLRKERFYTIKKPLFYRRIHNTNLTVSANYGIGSKIRRKYHSYIRECEIPNRWPNPNKVISPFEQVI